MNDDQVGTSGAIVRSSLLKKRLEALTRKSGGGVTARASLAVEASRLSGIRQEQIVVGTVWALLDTSSSMGGAPINEAKRGLEQFCAEVASRGFQVGVIAFNSSASVVAPVTANPGQLAASIQELEAEGGTAMAEAISLATKQLANVSAERIIFLVTDGEPNDRKATLAAARWARAADIEILTLGTEGADFAFLQLLATRAGLARQVAQTNLRQGIEKTARLLLTTEKV
jgi:Mg-chelatase subunit ChlD